MPSSRCASWTRTGRWAGLFCCPSSVAGATRGCPRQSIQSRRVFGPSQVQLCAVRLCFAWCGSMQAAVGQGLAAVAAPGAATSQAGSVAPPCWGDELRLTPSPPQLRVAGDAWGPGRGASAQCERQRAAVGGGGGGQHRWGAGGALLRGRPPALTLAVGQWGPQQNVLPEVLSSRVQPAIWARQFFEMNTACASCHFFSHCISTHFSVNGSSFCPACCSALLPLFLLLVVLLRLFPC